MAINEYNPHSKIKVAKNKGDVILAKKENAFINNESVDQYTT